MAIVLDPANGVTFNDLSLQGAAASPYVLKNRIINGAMVIDQRNAGASKTITDTSNYTYTLDRWGVYGTQASKFSVQQNAASVTPPSGFTKYLGVTSLSAYSILTTDRFEMIQAIEGVNTADLGWGTANAQTVTLSFWVRSSLTGTFGGSLQNSAGNRSYPFSYTISSANTWEQKTVTVTGDTTGTWVTDTTAAGIYLTFSLGIGSNRSGTAGAWAAANYTSVTGATSVVGTNGATFYITGVQLEVGSTATPFERRLYNQELANCQRYYYKYWVNYSNTARVALVGAYNATRAFGGMSTPVPMRTTPTLSYGSNTYFQLETLNLASSYAVTSFTIFAVNNTFSNNNYSVEIDVASGLTAGSVYHVSLLNTSGTATLGYYDFSAEL